MQALAELLGLLVGLALAPVVALRTRMRRRHLFHGDGRLLEGEMIAPPPAGLPPELRPFAQAIAGVARVRFSWAGGTPGARPAGEKRRAKILGLSLQLGNPQWPQHLLLATLRFRKPRIPGNPDDFLDPDNVYATVLRHQLRQVGGVYLRARPLRKLTGEGAFDILERATQGTGPHLCLELALARERERWVPVGLIRLRRLLPVGARPAADVYSDRALSPALSPFAAAAGLRTLGFLAGLRRILYPVSRWGRQPRAAEKSSGALPIKGGRSAAT